jgi:uncharacterized protein YkwD
MQKITGVLFLAALPLLPPGAGQAKDKPMPDLARVTTLVIASTNAFRAAEGRPKVTPDPALADAARHFAQFMARSGKYGHAADGSQPSERARKHGYDYCLVSENIAYHFQSQGFHTEELAGVIFEGWKASPGHRGNMLDAAATDTGVAVARSESGYFYAVQMFGRPRSARIGFEVRNESGAEVQYRVGDRAFTLPAHAAGSHETCRPEKLMFERPAKLSKAPLEPANGERFVITGDGSAPALRRMAP